MGICNVNYTKLYVNVPSYRIELAPKFTKYINITSMVNATKTVAIRLYDKMLHHNFVFC